MSISKQIAGLIIQIFLCTICFAQQREKIDSLKKNFLTAKDSQRINCLNELSKAYLNTQGDTASFYASLAFQEAKMLHYVQGMGDATLNSGKVEANRGNDSSARKFFLQAIPLYEKCNNIDMLGSAYLNLGLTLRDSSALEAYKKAIQLFQKVKDSSRSSYAMTMMGLTYQDMGNYEKAFEFGNQSLEIGKNIHDNYRVLWSLSNLGRLFQEVEDYPTAIDYYYNQPFDYAKAHNVQWLSFYDKVAEVYFSMHQDDSALYFLQKHIISSSDSASLKKALANPKTIEFNVGRIFLIKKEYDKALQNFLGVLKIAKSENNSADQMQILAYVAQTYLAKNDYEHALQYSKKLLTLAQNLGSRVFIRDGTELLWKVYDHNKSFDSAYKYYTAFTRMKDSITSYRFLTQMTSFKQAAANEKKELQFQQQLEQESFTKKILVISIIAILLISVFVLRFIALKRKNEAHQRKILQNELEIQKLEGEKTIAELQQQKTEVEMQALRAQMNPHFIFNSLNSINRFILKKQSTEATEYLTKFSRLIRMILNSSVNASVSLAEDLEALQLYLELERLRCEEKFSFKIKCDPDLDIDFIQVPPMLLQPFVENAIWHGLMNKEAEGHLSINIQQENSILICTIADDGIGRKRAAELNDKSGKHKSMGMKITESRIAMMQKMNKDKSIEIKDLVDADGNAAGTEVVLRIPITHEVQNYLRQ